VLGVETLTDTTSAGNAFVTDGQSVTFILTTNEAAIVAAGTTLTLSNGATAVYGGDGAASTSNSFTYTVAAGDALTGDLQFAGYAGSITDQTGHALSPPGLWRMRKSPSTRAPRRSSYRMKTS